MGIGREKSLTERWYACEGNSLVIILEVESEKVLRRVGADIHFVIDSYVPEYEYGFQGNGS